MDRGSEQFILSTYVGNRRREKGRLWVTIQMLSLVLGLFAIGTTVFAVLYATKTCDLSSSTGVPGGECSNATESKTLTVTPTPYPTTIPSGPWESAGETLTITESTTLSKPRKTVTATSKFTTEATRIVTSVLIMTSIYTTTVATSQSQPTYCPSGKELGGMRLLERGGDYYRPLIDLIIRNQPNSKDVVQSDQDVFLLSNSSIWYCGDNNRIVFAGYCKDGVVYGSDEADPGTCKNLLSDVPLDWRPQR